MAHPVAAAEDFSKVLAEVPGCYLHLGASVAPDGGNVAPNHSPAAMFDDSVLADGAVVLAELASGRSDGAPVGAADLAAADHDR
jgi:metal-dependent amidase/aminoacylase/carboxypeptidase family protein